MWIPVEVAHVAYGPATPSTAAVPQNLSTNYGGPRLMETDTVQNFPFGYIVRAFDPIHGYGEFMYLQGVAATVAGSRVTYVPHTGVTTIGDATANSGLPTAFAVAPCTAGLFGWYQVAGTALAVNNATAAVGTGKIAASGAITSSAVTGGQLLGGTIVVANGTTFTKVGTTRNGSTEVFFSNLDGVYVGLPISGTGIAGGTTVAAGYNNSPNSRNSSAGSAAGLIMSAAATADGTVTVTFTRTNFSLFGGPGRYTIQGQIT